MPLTTALLNSQDAEDRRLASQLLSSGGIVALPTETVYGLAADAQNEAAVAKVFKAKGRPQDHPLIVHIANAEELLHWAIDIPDEAWLLAKKFWPGPLTLLLKKAPHVSSLVTGGLDTIGLRVPNNPLFLELLERSQTGYAAPSANLYKQLSPTNAEQVMAGLNGAIDAVLDDGDCAVGLESTILDVTGQPLSILRSGPISIVDIERETGIQAVRPVSHGIHVPGNVEQHYQPRTPLYLASKDEIRALLQKSGSDTAVLHTLENSSLETDAYQIKMPSEKPLYAKQLYKVLHELDSKDLSAIWCEIPEMTEEWADVHDRLQRAASTP